MKFCDKLILIAVFIIILAVIHFVLPIINKLIDGKEGMVASSRGGVLTGNEPDFGLLEAAYGEESHGKIMLDGILGLLSKNLKVWHGEADCLTSILECLVAFSNSTAIRMRVIMSGIVFDL